MLTRLHWTFALLLLAGTMAQGDEPDWPTLPFTSHSAFQAVDASGAATFPLNDPVRMRGVVLNRPADMLNAYAAAPGYLGGIWQTFIETDQIGDAGGTALWMGQYIGRIVENHPAGSYTDEEWVAELDRLSHNADTLRRFRPGDVVEIRARAPGMFFRGKTNINEQHSNAPQQDFDVVLIAAGDGPPAPTTITLSDLKDAADEVIFDANRQTGPERYQGTLVRIEDVTFVDSNAWGPGENPIIEDATGRTFPVLLGVSRCFAMYDAPTAPFDIVGILDQEDLVGDDGWTDAYRLWVMGYDGTSFVIPSAPGDCDCDGDVDLADAAHLQTCFAGPGQAPNDLWCAGLDADFDGDIDLDDSDALIRCVGGPNQPEACN